MHTITKALKKNTSAPHRKAPRQALPAARTTDAKGRVALGPQFAQCTVIVEQLSDTEVVIKRARVIPEREAWLYESPDALAAVRAGLAQARAGQVAPGPDLNADAALAARLEG